MFRLQISTLLFEKKIYITMASTVLQVLRTTDFSTDPQGYSESFLNPLSTPSF